MSITLAKGGTALALHPDLYWQDEHSWATVAQAVERSVSGALIVDYAMKAGGRPITLAPIDDSSAWMPRAALETLKAWAALPDSEMTLNIRGEVRQVVFRHYEGAIDATPVVFYNDADAGDWFSITLRFMEI